MIWCSVVISSLTAESATRSSVGEYLLRPGFTDHWRRVDDAQFGLRSHHCRAAKGSHARRANRRGEKIPAAGNAQLAEDRGDLIFRGREFDSSLVRNLFVRLLREHPFQGVPFCGREGSKAPAPAKGWRVSPQRKTRFQPRGSQESPSFTRSSTAVTLSLSLTWESPGARLGSAREEVRCVRSSVMPPAELDGLEKICGSNVRAKKLAIDPRSYHGAIATMQHPAQTLVLRSDHFQVDGVSDDALHAWDFLRPDFG